MTCAHCPKPYTFNMDCRKCVIKHLRMVEKRDSHAWLSAYREKHGQEAMLKLIEEVKANG